MRAQRQSDGSVLFEGYVARPGVYTYQRADGSVVRELIPAAELHRPDALKTLGRKSLTLEHPDEDVSAENVTRYGVGDVAADIGIVEESDPQFAGYVRVQACVRRADAVAAFTSGTVVELSPGYDVEIDPTPGVDPVFGPYDAVQRKRDYNHLALCSRARGGPTIRARADSADVGVLVPPSENPPMKTLTLAAPLLLRLGALAGKPVRLDADGAPDLAAAGEALASLEANAPAAAAAVAAVEQMKKDIETIKATLATKEAELAKLTGTPMEVENEVEMAAEGDPMLDAAGAPVAPPAEMPKDPAQADACRMDAIRRGVFKVAAERSQLEGLASALRLDAAAVAKMGNAKLRKAVIEKGAPTARKDGSREYDRATIDHLTAGRRTDSAADPYAGLRDPSLGLGQRADADHEDAAPVSPTARYRAGFEARHAPRAEKGARS